MKLKLIYSLAFALVATLATTGCHDHATGKITPLPSENTGMVGGANPGGTIPSEPPITPTPEPVVGGGQTANLETFENMTEDRATLATDTIHFPYDSAAIRSSEQANLQAVAQALSANPNDKLLIEGNCDERGTEEYNRSLGERRALAAREALAQLGVDPSRIRTISYGKDRPVNPGHDEAAWAQNRRDDFVLLLPKAGV